MPQGPHKPQTGGLMRLRMARDHGVTGASAPRVQGVVATFLVRGSVVRSGGRPAPRSVRLVFWEGIRAGLATHEAGGVAGVSHEAARQWMIQAGGVISK